MTVSSSIHVLTASDVLGRLGALRSRQPVNYWAFYSSQLGGIVTDPALAGARAAIHLAEAAAHER